MLCVGAGERGSETATVRILNHKLQRNIRSDLVSKMRLLDTIKESKSSKATLLVDSEVSLETRSPGYPNNNGNK